MSGWALRVYFEPSSCPGGWETQLAWHVRLCLTKTKSTQLPRFSCRTPSMEPGESMTQTHGPDLNKKLTA